MLMTSLIELIIVLICVNGLRIIMTSVDGKQTRLRMMYLRVSPYLMDGRLMFPLFSIRNCLTEAKQLGAFHKLYI